MEKEILIPKIMRDRAKEIKCIEEVKEFETCCKANGVAMVFNCRMQNDVLKTCLARWYTNDHFVKECTEIYLNQRSEYRTTGLTKKQKARLAMENNKL